MSIQWHILAFEALSTHQLYQLLAARQAVFVLEQYCPYLDADGLDQQAFHLMGMEGEKLLAYARLLPAGVGYAEPSIGRVITVQEGRGKGLGKKLMTKAIEESEKLWGEVTIRIGAQKYLHDFYSKLGFTYAGKSYLEDGIPHIEMIRKAPQ
jgi:ElaA protein